MIVKFGTRKLALGIVWSYADSKSTLREHIKTARKRHVVHLTSDGGENWVGIADIEPGEKNVYAGAALVGLVSPNAIIAQSIGDEKYWICVIQDGKPVVGHDQIVTAEESHQVALSMMSMFQQAELYGDVSGATKTIEDVINELDEALANKIIGKSKLNECLLKKATLLSRRVISITFFILALAACWIVWGQYQAQQFVRGSLNANQKKLAEMAMTKEQQEANKERLLQIFNATVATKRAELAEELKQSHLDIWSQWDQVRKQLPLSTAGGYQPRSLECSLTKCTIFWEGAGVFTRLNDKQIILETTDSAPVKKFTSEIPLATLAPNFQPAATAAVARMNNNELQAHLMDLISADSIIYSGSTVDALQPIEITPPPDSEIKPVIIGQRGAIKIVASGPTALLQITTKLSRISGQPIFLKRVNFAGIGRSLNITIDATYALAH